MRSMFRPRRPSAAMVVAMLALFVALGGSSYAAVVLAKNSVLSKHIKDGQVRSADLAPNSVTGAKVKNGSIAKSDLAPGVAGFTKVERRQHTGSLARPCPAPIPGFTTCTGTDTFTASCAAGERATGGGVGDITDPAAPTMPGFPSGAQVLSSTPAVSDGVPSGWSVKVTSTVFLTSGTTAPALPVPVEALCAS